ncbi:MAG: SPOR domain-containing protein [Aestuariivirga sp.]
MSGLSAAATLNANTQLAAEAYRALSAGDPAAAIVSYSQAIESRELEPEVLANALLNRGLAYQHLNRHEQAIGDYSAAMRIDAMSGKLRAMALYNRGLSYQKLRQTALAMEDLTGALFLDAGFAHAYYARANLLRGNGQYIFALSDYERAIQSGYPEPARALYGESLTLDALNRPKNARDALVRAIAADPKFQPAQQRLAALDANLASPAAVDAITTASIASSAGEQLPQATAPEPELLGETEAAVGGVTLVSTARARKTITDRVPQEEETVAAVAPQEEKIVAIEPVADEPASEETTSAEETVEAEVQAAPQLTGWSVQVASAVSEGAAWSTWKKMQAKHGVLDGKTPIVVRADLGAKGTFYRVRLTGYDNQGDAKSACSQLKSKGVSCFISKASS